MAKYPRKSQDQNAGADVEWRRTSNTEHRTPNVEGKRRKQTITMQMENPVGQELDETDGAGGHNYLAAEFVPQKAGFDKGWGAYILQATGEP
jgi:hypothetical protein